MARMSKHLKLFTEPRADASGILARQQDTLIRPTADGWITIQHSDGTATEPGFVTLDAVRLAPAGPWKPWQVIVNSAHPVPASLEIEDRCPVGGGPDGAALKIMASFGAFGVAAVDGKIMLASNSAAVVGPLDEWRPQKTGFTVPSSVLTILALGPTELEIEGERLYVSAGILRACAGVVPYEGVQAGAILEYANVTGVEVQELPDSLKRPLKKLTVHVESLGEINGAALKKYSSEIAPGWVFVKITTE
jgi:hypothetical protein